MASVSHRVTRRRKMMLFWRFGKLGVMLFLLLVLAVSLPASVLADASSGAGTS